MSPGHAELAIDPMRGGVAIWIHVTPRARRPRLGGVHDGALRVAVTEPPVEGKANAACVRALAEGLALRRDDVTIDPGSRGRRKRVTLTGPPEPLRLRLRMLASGDGLR